MWLTYLSEEGPMSQEWCKCWIPYPCAVSLKIRCIWHIILPIYVHNQLPINFNNSVRYKLDNIANNIFTDSGYPIKWLLRVPIRRAPDPPNPLDGKAKVFCWGVWHIDLSYPHGIKYIWQAIDLQYHVIYSWGVPQPPWPLTPLHPNRGGPGRGAGAWMRAWFDT